jgi:hypothetical protein
VKQNFVATDITPQQLRECTLPAESFACAAVSLAVRDQHGVLAYLAVHRNNFSTSAWPAHITLYSPVCRRAELKEINNYLSLFHRNPTVMGVTSTGYSGFSFCQTISLEKSISPLQLAALVEQYGTEFPARIVRAEYYLVPEQHVDIFVPQKGSAKTTFQLEHLLTAEQRAAAISGTPYPGCPV